MNIGTIAESVQDPSSLPTIWQFGVEYIQGYFLQEPDAAMSYDFNQLVL
jgi:EAL domain-containing protein (putative c-di-GMP-specific phosphodiesterase class I)